MSFQLLNPSFRVEWPTNPIDVTEKVLQELKSIASPIRFSTKRKERRRKKKIENQSSEMAADSIWSGSRETTSDDKKSTELDIKKTIFNESCVVGIANILRHLERQDLAMVFFERSFLRPAPVAQFIGMACISSTAHCICMDGLSESLAPILNVKSASAIGIKKTAETSSDAISSMVSTVRNLTKPVIFVTSQSESETGGVRKKKNRKRLAEFDESGIMEGKSEDTSYVEATVSIRSQSKKKRK